jgi:hypothetical protein
MYVLLVVEFKSAPLASSSESGIMTTQFNVHMPVSVVAFLRTFPLYGFMNQLTSGKLTSVLSALQTPWQCTFWNAYSGIL